MVGSMMLMKMLHCRRKESKTLTMHAVRRDIPGEGTSQNLMEINVKRETSTDETCRICLKEGKLPIFGEAPEELREWIYEIGAIEVCADDPYPKFLCQSCHALLQGAIFFRKTAQGTDEKLKKTNEPVKKSEAISETDESYSDDFGTTGEELNAKQTTTSGEQGQVKCPIIRRCNLCDLQFNTFQEYSDHRMSDEHENKRITCSICKKTYGHQYYKRHMTLHKSEMGHMCDICGKKFAVQSQFARHRLTHFYDLPFQCDFCPYRGRFTESLKMHMRSHTGEKPYQCEQCPSRFINKSNLNKHKLTHNGVQNFSCEVCGRAFYTKRELELHIKVDHTGIREHICRICGKAFGYRKQMMKHELRVHKREKLKSGRMPIYLKLETMKNNN
ncbi:Uncharacterized protein OBRU01_01168 [Operophtera brumata]|uniref:Uncharacterized protein n=1 Tax=Operophtera brumata TaxID=104452 RepID=A0A0L7LRQ9_OPEBR|nr:Uncharacterized protein OBRU01_01168 [Operophtera brumata]